MEFHMTDKDNSLKYWVNVAETNEVEKRFIGDLDMTGKFDFSQVCERSSQWCELRYSQVQTAH